MKQANEKNELMGCDERSTTHISQVFWVNSGAVGGLRLQTCVQRTQKRSDIMAELLRGSANSLLSMIIVTQMRFI